MAEIRISYVAYEIQLSLMYVPLQRIVCGYVLLSPSKPNFGFNDTERMKRK